MPTSQPLRVLIVEDNDLDAELVVRAMKQAGFTFTWQRVDSESAYQAALDAPVDVILADFSLPAFGALPALRLLKDRRIDVPFIVVSGSIGEDMAVNLLHEGASDYLLKDRLGRLGQAVKRALDDRALLRAKQAAEASLRRIEERTRFAMQAARVGTWEIDLATGLRQWSDTFEAMHGLPPGTFDGTTDSAFESIHVEDRALVKAAIEQATLRRRDWNISYRTVWPDASVHWINDIGRTFYDEAGAPVRAAGVGLDVTEQRALEEQYRQSQKMEAFGQLAGGVAHDFNNLLTAIHGYSDLLIESLGPENPHQRDLLEIRRAAERATSLTRQLLAFGRRQLLEPRVLDLREAIVSMEPILKRLIGEDVEVIVRVESPVGRVRADAGQIEQVILNLAINARDAMPDGGTLLIELRDVELDDAAIKYRSDAKAGRYVGIIVSDTGIGMDAATRARVFEPFFTTKDKGRGTGLGLSTVYGIVKQSEGTIWLYSEPGRGTTFKVYLPRVDAEVDAPEPPIEVDTLTGSEIVLLVEDEESVRDLVVRVLEQRGYTVLWTHQPADVPDLAAQIERIDLLISDIVLPQTSGPALAERLRSVRPHLPVLYISGYTDQMLEHRGMAHGTPFLQKPFTPHALARKVREVLAKGGHPSAL